MTGLGPRFLAVMAAMALGASTAFVGLSMAQGTWNTVGVGLAPGEGYALSLSGQADRLRLELANPGSDAVASFSVYAPSGARAGYHVLNADTRIAEVVTTPGVWMVFVYKAQAADLQLSFHGATDAGAMAPAKVERKELSLGNVQGTQAVDATYTAMLEQEPVLAGVYLKGSARGFQSELRSDKGLVEVVNEQELSSVGGMVVESRGERTTLPQNLAAGPYTAKVQASSMSGSLLLVGLYLKAPSFDKGPVLDDPPANEKPKPKSVPKPPHGHKHKAPPAPPVAPLSSECGVAEAQTPYALELRGGSLVMFHTRGSALVSVFDPQDALVGLVEVKGDEHEEDDDGTSSGPGGKAAKPDRHRKSTEEAKEPGAMLPLGRGGEYVLYPRFGSVEVHLMGDVECELRELTLEASMVAVMGGERVPILGQGTSEAVFELERAPLEFAIRLSGPHAAAMGMQVTFAGPAGEAAYAGDSFALGAAEHMPLPLFWGHGGQARYADSDPERLVPGEWTAYMDSTLQVGEIEAYAIHYLREAAEPEDA